MEPKARFALDHNFPAPVLAAFAELMPEVQLVPVTDIDASFADLDDWELFVALHRHPSGWDGLITNDRSLLGLPKEMTVLSQTTLTLIVASGQGHNPIRAVGVLLCHLSHICHHTKKDRAQVWELSVAQKDYKEPHDFLERIASRQDTTIEKLVETNKLPSRELTRK